MNTPIDVSHDPSAQQFHARVDGRLAVTLVEGLGGLAGGLLGVDGDVGRVDGLVERHLVRVVAGERGGQLGHHAIAQTLPPGESVDDELRHLTEALAVVPADRRP